MIDKMTADEARSLRKHARQAMINDNIHKVKPELVLIYQMIEDRANKGHGTCSYACRDMLLQSRTLIQYILEEDGFTIKNAPDFMSIIWK